MKLTILGSGTNIPHPQRSASGYWLEIGAGTILLDCAASAIQRIAQEKLDWANLDAIWISHFHLDHVGGLAPFLAGTKHAAAMRERKKPLRIFGAQGLEKLLKNFDAANDYKLFAQPFPLEITEVEPLENFEILTGVEAVALKTPHTDESLAVHLRERSGKTLVYTADTGFTMTLGSFARAADLLLMECSYFENKPVEKHLQLSEAMRLVRFAAPRRTVLTHFYPDWDAIDFDAEVKKFAPPGEVIAARDGLRLEI